jgi:UDPglucose 6-dehydrogenase
LQLLQAVNAINHQQQDRFLKKIRSYFEDRLKTPLSGKTLAVWGAAFKPGTDDVREAPSLRVIGGLLEAGATVQVYDPKALPLLKEAFRGVAAAEARLNLVTSAYRATEGADALVLLTEWPEFRQPDWSRLKQTLRGRVIVDGRNQYDLKTLEREGFDYLSIGRSAVFGATGVGKTAFSPSVG